MVYMVITNYNPIPNLVWYKKVKRYPFFYTIKMVIVKYNHHDYLKRINFKEQKGPKLFCMYNYYKNETFNIDKLTRKWNMIKNLEMVKNYIYKNVWIPRGLLNFLYV